MNIECKILPITTVRVTIKDGDEVFCCDVPFPNECIEDKEYDYKSEAIETAKDNYEYLLKNKE